MRAADAVAFTSQCDAYGEKARGVFGERELSYKSVARVIVCPRSELGSVGIPASACQVVLTVTWDASPPREFQLGFHDDTEMFARRTCASMSPNFTGALPGGDEKLDECEMKVTKVVEGHRMVRRHVVS